MQLAVTLHQAAEQLPDADTDVLVFTPGDDEGQLGAYVGHDEHGPIWVDSQGEGIAVDAWCELPRRAAPSQPTERTP